jgi:hypothetical protein
MGFGWADTRRQGSLGGWVSRPDTDRGKPADELPRPGLLFRRTGSYDSEDCTRVPNNRLLIFYVFMYIIPTICALGS